MYDQVFAPDHAGRGGRTFGMYFYISLETQRVGSGGHHFAPDLLGSMMNQSRLAKVEMSRIPLTMNQFRSRIQTSKVLTIRMS